MITNFSNGSMHGISASDHETIAMHLTDQLSSAAHRNGWPHDDETYQAAEDALNSEWVETMTANEWLAAAGKRLGVDTSGCVGA